MDLGAILNWLKYRKNAKNKEIAETVLMNLHSMTVTVHGRQLLSQICADEDNDLLPEIRRMYWILLEEAPIALWASWN